MINRIQVLVPSFYNHDNLSVTRTQQGRSLHAGCDRARIPHITMPCYDVPYLSNLAMPWARERYREFGVRDRMMNNIPEVSLPCEMMWD